MRLVYFGTPEFAVLPLQLLLNSDYEVLAVVTQPDRQSGRGRRVHSCPVKELAQKAGLEIMQPQKVRDQGFIKDLKRVRPSLIVVAAYGQILPPEIIHLPELGCVNIHASLLPAYRGAAPINRAIINGDKKTGVTTMLMDEGMDTGPVLLQKEAGILPDDTAGSLSRKLSQMGAELLIQTLHGMERGEVRPMPQVGEVSYAPILKKNDGLIHWSQSAEELNNFIRGMMPWPGAYGFLQKERVKIIKAVPVEGNGEPGVICRPGKDQMFIGTGKGFLSVLEIQPAGRPVMSVHAFLQGRTIREGTRFSIQDPGK